jgi:ferric-dicitrate binding protein FerR (iron transport regulator)
MPMDEKSADDVLTGLLRRSGRRELPPTDVVARVQHATLKIWESQQRRRRAWRLCWNLAAGLALFGVVGGVWQAGWFVQDFGTLELGQDLHIAAGRWSPSLPDDAVRLRVGDTIATGATGARIRRVDGAVIQLDSGTALQLTSPSLLQLERGRMFIDTGRERARSLALLVQTAYGVVEHIGTQFLIDLRDQHFTLAVRDGAVAVTTHAAESTQTVQRVTLAAGEVLQIDSSGQQQRARIGPFDSGWQWSDALARPISIEGRSLDAVLTDVAQRSGLDLSYANSAAATQAHRVVLHGPYLLLSPRVALDAALAGTTLADSVRGHELVIHER